jgi:DNA-directed RNA polymerase II subunit RPB1
MGPIDRRLECGTCKNTVVKCSGHCGHIDLAYPVYHIGYMQSILKILRMTCFWCCRILVPPDDPKIQSVVQNRKSKDRFSDLVNLIKNKKVCAHCEGKQPKYKIGEKAPFLIKIKWDDVKLDRPEDIEFASLPFTSREALNILEHVPDEDYQLMGFDPKKSHPSWMIITALVVPPPLIRPSITEAEGLCTKGHDDLSHKLKNIVTENKKIHKFYYDYAEKHGINVNDIDFQTIQVDQDKILSLQSEVATYINNEIKGHKQSIQRSGAPTKSITSRFRGKEGRFRGNLMGKRVNFSGRTVISPDSQMSLEGVGVPEYIALQLTYPETVTDYNIQTLSERVRVGYGKLDGAFSVIDSDGKIIELEGSDINKQIQLQPGWKVERYLQNGDIVIFNRQPSLHKGSMMAHIVQIRKTKTFSLNLGCTIPYNADFDGDEVSCFAKKLFRFFFFRSIDSLFFFSSFLLDY